jgi:hypothetical protein
VALAPCAASCAPDRGPLFRATGDGADGTGGLRGEYFAGLTFNASSRVIERVDPRVAFDWGSGAPDSRLPVDSFQARWTGFLTPLASGDYTFRTRSDDGVRLWVDERLLVDEWVDRVATEDVAPPIALAQGVAVPIKLDYFERLRLASVELRWASGSGAAVTVPAAALRPPAEVQGLSASYFAGKAFETLRASRVDLDVDFAWGLGSPHPDVPTDGFSARWTGTLEARESDAYTFYTEVRETNEGVRLWIDGQKVIDDWAAPHTLENAGTVPLRAGQRHAIVLEYFEDVGAASLKLRWSTSRQPKVVVSWHRLRP